MTKIDNHTSFPTELFSFPDTDGQEDQVLVLAGTWIRGQGDGLEPAPEQRPIQLSDEYFGDPVSSSVRYESQTATEKRYVDVLVNGSAHAPRGKPIAEMTVRLRAANIDKSVRVLGDRFSNPFGISSPVPFTTMPLVYERAYGGLNLGSGRIWNQNPVGIGFRGSRSNTIEITTEYANLEPLNSPLEGPPAGFGVISRAWSPRLEFAGSFDDEWSKTQWPLLPRNFDPRHYQAAPIDQQVHAIGPGESFQLTNFTPDGIWIFRLPCTSFPAALLFDSETRAENLRLDTIHIEPDAHRVSLTFRMKLPRSRHRNRLREVVVGRVTAGMLRAKQKRKPFLDLRLLGGAHAESNGSTADERSS